MQLMPILLSLIAFAVFDYAVMIMMMQAVQEVARNIQGRRKIQLIVDPVMVATCGDSLATSEVGAAMVQQ